MNRFNTQWVGDRIEHDPELGRLRALERVFDPTTVRFLDEFVQVPSTPVRSTTMTSSVR
jgi:hypothetical protein